MVRIITLALFALLLASCGVRGGLEPPPDARPKKDKPIVLDPLI